MSRVVRSWRNYATPWWRRSWEACVHGTHVLAWTQKGALKKATQIKLKLESHDG